jgi:hypothetical protein
VANNPNRVVTLYLVSKLFGLAYKKAATIETYVNAFQKHWTLHLQSFIFRDHDFEIHSQHEDQNHHAANESVIKPKPGNSKCSQRTSSSHVRQSDIRPLPVFGQRKTDAKGTKRRGGSANVITSSPYKKNFVTSLKRSSARQTRATARKQELCSKNKASVKKTKKPKSQNVSDREDGSDFDRILVHSESFSNTADDENAECLFCTCLYSQDQHGEQWVQCLKFYCWAHEHCGAQDQQLVCPTCRASNKQENVIFCFVNYVKNRTVFKIIFIITWVSY